MLYTLLSPFQWIFLPFHWLTNQKRILCTKLTANQEKAGDSSQFKDSFHWLVLYVMYSRENLFQ